MNGGVEFVRPFAVCRQIGTSMEDQLVSGFSKAIRGGVCREGQRLPGIRQLARIFGVSEITIRHAVTRLCREGLLQARPRVGLTVCGGMGRSFRGLVLGVKAGPLGAFNVAVVEGAIADTLRRNGWLYTSVSVGTGDKITDWSALDMLIDSSVALVVTYDAPPSLTNRIIRAGVKFVEVRPHRASLKSAFVVKDDPSAALAELGEVLLGRKVKSVVSVYQHTSAASLYSSGLRKAGLTVESMRVPPVDGRNTQACVQRAALLAFDRLVFDSSFKPQAIVSDDDYLSAGILSAFDRWGVHMPDDFRFATFANVGLGPVHRQDLTRIEHNPVKVGTTAGEAIVRYLETGRCERLCAVPCQFVRGTTV